MCIHKIHVYKQSTWIHIKYIYTLIEQEVYTQSFIQRHKVHVYSQNTMYVYTLNVHVYTQITCTHTRYMNTHKVHE